MTLFIETGFNDVSDLTVTQSNADVLFDGKAKFSTISTSTSAFVELSGQEHAPTNEVYARFKFKASAYPATSNTDLFSIVDDQGTRIAAILLSNGAPRFRVSHGATFSGPSDLMPDQEYHCFFYFKSSDPGLNNGIITFAYSTDGTEPATPNIVKVDGTSEGLAARERFAVFNRGYMPVELDYLVTADEAITDAQVATANVNLPGPKIVSAPSVDEGQAFDIQFERVIGSNISVSIDGTLVPFVYDGNLTISVTAGWASTQTGIVDLIVADDTGTSAAYPLSINIPVAVLLQQSWNTGFAPFGYTVSDAAGFVSFENGKVSMESASGGNSVLVRTPEIDFPNDFWVEFEFHSESYAPGSDVDVMQLVDGDGNAQAKVGLRSGVPRFIVRHGSASLAPVTLPLDNTGETYYLYLHVVTESTGTSGTADLYFNTTKDFATSRHIPVAGGTSTGDIKSLFFQHNSRDQGTHTFDNLLIYTGHPDDFANYTIADDAPPPPTILDMSEALAGGVVEFLVDTHTNPTRVTASNANYSLELTDITVIDTETIHATMPLGGAPRGELLTFRIEDDNGLSTTQSGLYLSAEGYSTALIAVDPVDAPSNSIYKLPEFSEVRAGDVFDYKSLIDDRYPVSINEFGVPQVSLDHPGGNADVEFTHLDASQGYEAGSGIVRFTTPDIKPGTFTLGADVLAAEPNEEIIRSITISGIAENTPVQAVALQSAQLSVDQISWAPALNVELGDVIYVRLFAAGNRGGSVAGGISVNGISATFSVTTFAGNLPIINQASQLVNAGGLGTLTLTNPFEGTLSVYLDGEALTVNIVSTTNIEFSVPQEVLYNRLVTLNVTDNIGTSNAVQVFLAAPTSKQAVLVQLTGSDLFGSRVAIGDQVVMDVLDSVGSRVYLNQDLTLTFDPETPTGSYLFDVQVLEGATGYTTSRSISITATHTQTISNGNPVIPGALNQLLEGITATDERPSDYLIEMNTRLRVVQTGSDWPY